MLKFLYVGLLVALALILVSLIYYGLVRWVTREQRKTIRQLQQQISDLEAAEPDKLRRLRMEVRGYDTLTDLILDQIVQHRTMLNLSDLGEAISNLIVAKRPERTL